MPNTHVATAGAETDVTQSVLRSEAPALRILFLVDELESISAGGSERQVLQLIDILRHAGHEVSLAVLRESHWLQEERKEYPVRFCDVQSILSPAGMLSLWKLIRWIRAQRFDVVQTMFREANLIGPPLAKLAGVPLVLGSRRNLNYAMNRRFALLQRFSNRFATRLVANSKAVKDIVSQQERTSLTKIDVLYNGVDTRYFAAQPASRLSSRSRLGISESTIVVGVVSRFARIKGLDIFVRAARQVLSQYPEICFMMVGDGPMLPEVQALATHLNIQEKCKFIPAQRDIRAFLSSFDVAVLPSRSEGFSNALLEYMSAGVAIVSTDVGGNGEALGDTGLLVPSENDQALAKAIVQLIENPEQRKALGQSAQKRVQELFDTEQARTRVSDYVNNLAKYFVAGKKRLARRNF